MRYCLNYSDTSGFCPLKSKTKITQFSDYFRLDNLFLRHTDPAYFKSCDVFQNSVFFRPALAWSLSRLFRCVLLHDPHTVGPYVTDGSITFV